MANQATYDPALDVITIAGYRLTGFVTDSGFSSDMADNAFDSVVGNLGLGAFTRIRSGRATITLTLLPSSDDNDVLMAIYQASTLNPGGGLVPMARTLANGRTKEAGAVYVQKLAPTNQGLTPNVWTLISLNWVKFVGGLETSPIFTTLAELQEAIAQAPQVPAPT